MSSTQDDYATKQSANSVGLQAEFSQMQTVMSWAIESGSTMIERIMVDCADKKFSMRTRIAISIMSDLLAKADAVSILLGHRTAETAKVISRSVIECVLALECVLVDETGDLAWSYFIEDKEKELKCLKRLIPGTAEYEDVYQKSGAGDVLHEMDTGLSTKFLRNRALELETQLKNAKCAEIKSKLQAIGGRTKWFTLTEGNPRNIRDLAARWNLLGNYEFVYRNFSGSTHGTGSHRFFQNHNEKMYLLGLRRAEAGPTVFEICMAMISRANRMIASALGDRSMEIEWQYVYLSRVRTPYKRLSEIKIEYVVS